MQLRFPVLFHVNTVVLACRVVQPSLLASCRSVEAFYLSLSKQPLETVTVLFVAGIHPAGLL